MTSTPLMSGKNVLNFFRQDHGYKAGYVRQAAGMGAKTTNIWWSLVADRWTRMPRILPIRSIGRLSGRYREVVSAGLSPMDGEDNNRLSTTALAKKLNIPAQQLFATLKDYGWIQRAGDTWALTPKGEFEGGGYQQSQALRPLHCLAGTAGSSSFAGCDRVQPAYQRRRQCAAITRGCMPARSIAHWRNSVCSSTACWVGS